MTKKKDVEMLIVEVGEMHAMTEPMPFRGVLLRCSDPEYEPSYGQPVVLLAADDPRLRAPAARHLTEEEEIERVLEMSRATAASEAASDAAERDAAMTRAAATLAASPSARAEHLAESRNDFASVLYPELRAYRFKAARTTGTASSTSRQRCPRHLECGHCGGIAFTSRDIRDGVSWFTDGDGEECDTCGMPGSVYVDDDYEDEDDDSDYCDVRWQDVQAARVYCTRADCEECDESRAATTAAFRAARAKRDAASDADERDAAMARAAAALAAREGKP